MRDQGYFIAFWDQVHLIGLRDQGHILEGKGQRILQNVLGIGELHSDEGSGALYKGRGEQRHIIVGEGPRVRDGNVSKEEKVIRCFVENSYGPPSTYPPPLPRQGWPLDHSVDVCERDLKGQSPPPPLNAPLAHSVDVTVRDPVGSMLEIDLIICHP